MSIELIMLITFCAGAVFGYAAGDSSGYERGRRDMDAEWRKAEWR